MKALISGVLLGVAVYIIAFDHSSTDAAQKWAYGIIGTIVGYWLRR
ncbi:MAG: hypothetical protein JOY54_03755 [Acidobacteriaceae bacterium]|nr:hypothetical protein [Acidobacteriaceae bacterium]